MIRSVDVFDVDGGMRSGPVTIVAAANEPVLPSGLLGPVRIVRQSAVEDTAEPP